MVQAKLLNLSNGGCAIELPKKFRLDLDEEIRIATTQGSYVGVVRRFEWMSESETWQVGLQFKEEIEGQIKAGSLFSFYSDPRHSLTTFASPLSIMLFIGVWGASIVGSLCYFGVLPPMNEWGERLEHYFTSFL